MAIAAANPIDKAEVASVRAVVMVRIVYNAQQLYPNTRRPYVVRRFAYGIRRVRSSEPASLAPRANRRMILLTDRNDLQFLRWWRP